MPQPIGPDLVRHLRNVADPELSPDASLLAYTLSWVEHEHWESRSRIMVQDLATQETSQLTSGDKDSAPRFSPDGQSLAFLRAEGDSPKQLWAMKLDGRESTPVSSGPGVVLDFAWSPNSRQLVYCADVNPDEPTDPGDNSPLPQTRRVRRTKYRFDTLGWRGDSHFHLFIADLDGNPVSRITNGDWDDLSPTWSPDGSQIAFISGRRDGRDFHAMTEAYVVPASGGEPALWSNGLSSVGAVTWSPDGRRLLVVGSESPGFLVVWQGWLYVLEPGREPVCVTDDSLRPLVGFPTVGQPPQMRWTDDEQILLLGENQGESFLYGVSVVDRKALQITGGGCLSSDVSLDAGGRTAAVLSSSNSSPTELHLVNVSSGTANQVTNYNHDYLVEHPPAQMEKFAVSRGGWDIQCRLYFPPDFDQASTYPLILDIHGGPNGAYYDSFVAWQQMLATNGYLVLAANPRGSSTYGKDFMMAVLGDWGGEDYLDLMAALDEVAARPYVDSTRLGVHGYSYGGYMSSWAVGHTQRFQAAVVGAPCTNLHSLYGTSDIGISFGELQWNVSVVDSGSEGYPDMAQRLLERSPISYAANVQTPVLLLHGESDARCPISQSEEYFAMLKRLGKKVEMVRFPGCSHLFLRTGHAKMREEYLSCTLDWFNRHLS